MNIKGLKANNKSEIEKKREKDSKQEFNYFRIT